MKNYSITILMVVIALSTINLVSAQNEYLAPHNSARSAVGVGPISWDNNLANYAWNYINNNLKARCNLVHSQGPYGENLAMSTGDMSPQAAVKLWVDEKRYYNYNSNSCVGGVCGHYTQVVWRNSVRMGCAKVRCNSGGTVISCNYSPPGNFNGQRPY